MRYNDYGTLGQIVQSALSQAEQALRTGRLESLQPQQRNVQLFRVAPGSSAPMQARSQQQADNTASAAMPDSQQDDSVYREASAAQTTGRGATAPGRGTTVSGRGAAASGQGTAASGQLSVPNTAASSARVPDERAKTDLGSPPALRLNFNEENLLSGIVMAEVLGKPRCFRRGRW
ncbi:MAG TPA: hypothetical protein VHT96_12355 [Clostridia bacterium]|nr:hypothetical protein [Clostridia bacterium]